MFLEIVSFAGDVCGNFHAVGEADTRDLSDCGVRLTRRLGRDTSADTALEGRIVKSGAVLERVEAARECHGLRAPRLFDASAPYELVYG